MLAAVIERPGELQVRDLPVPYIDETECIVEILACSICNSTDRKLLDGHFRYCGADAYPGVLGHESVGRIIECGSQVKSFKVGDLVLRPGARYDHGEEDGINSLWGGMAQYGKVKDPLFGGNRMHQIVPDDINPDDATMLITLKETLSWLQRWPVQRGQSVLVMGSGPVGVSFGFFAKLLGCGPVAVMGRRDEPLQKALALGVDSIINTSCDNPYAMAAEITDGKGFDRVIEAVGDDALVELGLELMANEGRLGIYGISPTQAPGDMERRAIDIGKGRAEWCTEFFGPQEWAPHDHLLWLVKQGIVNLHDYFTHEVTLEDIATGFELLESKEAFKVVVRM